MSWLLILICLTLVVFFLPFVPSIVEWKKMTDARPLDVNSPDRTIIDHKLRLFKAFITKHFSLDLQKYSRENISHEGRLANGTEYYITGKEGSLDLPHNDLNQQTTKKVIIACKPTILPDNFIFQNRVYTASSLISGKANQFTNVLSDGDITIKQASMVKNFIYSAASMQIEQFSVLNGYAQAAKEIKLAGNNQFQCLYAPRIEVGEVSAAFLSAVPKVAQDVFSLDMERKIIHGDFKIADDTQIAKHLIVKGKFHIGERNVLKGNIKCDKNMVIGSDTTIIGAIICEGDVLINDNCNIQGPIVSRGLMTIGKNCVIGTEDTMTSVIGKNIQIAAGSVFFGLLFAKLEGSFLLNTPG